MSLDDVLPEFEGNYFTISEYDTLCIAAMNGGLVESPDLDSPTDEIPEELTEWIEFCEYIRSCNAILHMVLAGVLVPVTQEDDVESGYRYEKSEMADIIIENMGVGKL